MKPKNTTHRRQFLQTLSALTLSSVLPFESFSKQLNLKETEKGDSTGRAESMDWKVGIGKRVITPQTKVWLAGYGYKRVPYGKIHDIYVKVMALKSSDGKVVVMATTDHQGMSKTVYNQIYNKIYQRFKIERSQFMLTFSHNHSGPRLTDDLHDYYPVESEQEALVNEYSEWMSDQIVEAVDEALDNWQNAKLYKGEGLCRFAVNRRENVESEVAEILDRGAGLKGPVDHYVPVLAIKGEGGQLISVLFGYACHPTTISLHTWSGDYPGFAQINLEASHPGTAAMFFNTCGGDQNPLPRRTMELVKKYGKMLSDAVEEVLNKPMEPVSSALLAGFEYVDLEYQEMATKESLMPIASSGSKIQARWAKRMLAKLETGEKFPTSYAYPVQAWKLGEELLLIGIGGESVVDYSLRFKKQFPEQTTWVCGYANEMAAYIPSHRVWEEGGYEGGPHLDEYGHPAWKWAENIEDEISETVAKVVEGLPK